MVFLGSPRFFSPLFSSTLDLTRWELATLRWREHSVRLEPCKSGIYYSHVSQTVNGSSKHQKAGSTSGRVALRETRFFSAPRFRFLAEVDRLRHLNGIFPLSPRLFRQWITRADTFAENDSIPPYREGGTHNFKVIIDRSVVDAREHVCWCGARSRGSIFDHGRFPTTFFPPLRCGVRLVRVSTSGTIVMVIDACWYRCFRIPRPLGELCVSSTL